MLYLVSLGSTITLYVTTVNGSRTPTVPDSAASYRIYGPSSTTVVASGSFSGSQVDGTNAPFMYAASSVGITSGNGFASGNAYLVRIQWAISSTNYVQDQTIICT